MASSPDALAWMAKAEEDAKLARLAEAAGLSDYASSIAYHCQQCAEKCLKAYLVQRGSVFPKTHDFAKLIALCSGHDPRFAQLTPAGQRLQPFAVEVRYPYDAKRERSSQGASRHG